VIIDYSIAANPEVRLDNLGGSVSRHILQGLKEIADHLGLQANSLDARRLLHSWITREGLPARRLAGRWYAEATEIESWWASRTTEIARMRKPAND
jgi:hypothetical protein